MPEPKPLHFQRLLMTRIVAKPEALDAVSFDELSFRVAPDELYILGDVNTSSINDDFAIIRTEASMSSVYLDTDEAMHFLEHECAWKLPTERPAFVQGMVAHLAVKLYFEREQVLFMVAAPFAHDLEQHMRKFL